MTVGLKERADAYLEAGEAVRAIDQQSGSEEERLEKISDVLVDLAGRAELFPTHAFPRTPGTSGGLFRLVEYPDRRDAIYMSLGFTGRSQTPHRHASWAIVAGVSGGVETNNLYDFREEEGEHAASLTHRGETAVGPGEAVAIGTGVFHTIDVRSDDPVLHLHAYGLTVDKEGSELPVFDSPAARTYKTRSTGGFRPPLSVVIEEDVREDLAAGRVALVLLDCSSQALDGPHIFDGLDTLQASGLDSRTPVVLVGTEEASLDAAILLYRAGWPLVFRLLNVAQVEQSA